jgi:multidrug resistance protein
MISRDFSILLLSLVVVALGFGILTPILPIFAQQRLGIDLATTGWMYALFAVSFTLFMLPAGYWADRVGRKPLIVGGIVIFGVTTLLLAFISEAWQFGVLRFVEGFGAAIVTPASFALTVDIVPENRRGVAMGTEATAELLGALGGPALGGYLAEFLGFNAPFYVAAVLAFVCASLVMLIRERRVNVPEKRMSLFSMFQSWRRSARQNRALLAVTGRGFVMGIVQGLWNLGLISFWHYQLGMDLGQIGFAVSIEVLVMLLGALPFGSASDKYGRRPFILVGGALMASGLFFTVAVTDIWQVYLLVAISAAGAAMSNPSVGGMLADVMLAEERGRVMGAYQFVLGIGNIVGLVLLGYMYVEISPEAPIVLCSLALAIATTIIAVFVSETHRVPSTDEKVVSSADETVVGMYGSWEGKDLIDK